VGLSSTLGIRSNSCQCDSDTRDFATYIRSVPAADRHVPAADRATCITCRLLFATSLGPSGTACCLPTPNANANPCFRTIPLRLPLNALDIELAPPPVIYWSKAPICDLLPTRSFRAHGQYGVNFRAAATTGVSRTCGVSMSVRVSSSFEQRYVGTMIVWSWVSLL
jgi:hypothetical protein